jgi:hypothetical protein
MTRFGDGPSGINSRAPETFNVAATVWLSGERMGSWQAQTLSVGVRKLEVQFGFRIVSDIRPKEVDVWTINLPLVPRSKSTR